VHALWRLGVRLQFRYRLLVQGEYRMTQLLNASQLFAQFRRERYLKVKEVVVVRVLGFGDCLIQILKVTLL
jgi:hypothetical protein